MNTKPLEKFAQNARRQLHEQVKTRLEQVLRTDSAELRAKADVVAELNKQIARSSRTAVIEQVAYTWFNRFCALRYMDVNGYTRMGIVSPAEGNTQPEMLQEAKAGHIDPDLSPFVDSQRIFDLLDGRLPSPNAQQEAYRLLLVGACNQYHSIMPFLFEPIDDYTELLMPDDLLSAASVLAAVRVALTAETCQDVEVIGWLYQFYISEKKDAVIGAKKPVAAADIPAATQLFTPHWIVRYLVENSLGRLWLLNRPGSRLAEQMEFYIGDPLSVNGNQSDTTDYRPPITDYLKINSPEELTLCDPAVGSAHMLTYAFDLLYAMYEEAGYNAPDIPRLILEKNLYGMEIDERAGALAAFALVMKARARDRRFFRRTVLPAITVLRPITFTDEELSQEVHHLLNLSFRAVPGEESLRSQSKGIPRSADSARNDARAEMENALRHDLLLFLEADNVGSLLRPQLSVAQLAQLQQRLAQDAPPPTDLFTHERRQRVQCALAQAEALARQYHVVLANPPYMGSKNQNEKVKKFLNDYYPNVKADLFSAFTVRIMEMTQKGGFIGMMTPFNWMFLSSFEKLREMILDNYTLTNLVRPEFHAFFDSAYVTVCGFTLFADSLPEYKGAFIDLQAFYGADLQPVKALEAIQNPECGWFFRATAVDFQKIPGSPIAYWVSRKLRDAFASGKELKSIGDTRQGMATSDNNRFLRAWYEVAQDRSCFSAKNHHEAKVSDKMWFPYNKGGEFRKWYGNNEHMVNWAQGGKELLDYAASKYGSPTRTIKSMSEYFKPSVSWSKISSSNLAMRYYPPGYIFDVAGCCIFSDDEQDLLYLLGLTNTILVRQFLSSISPTLNFEAGHIAKLPILKKRDYSGNKVVEALVNKEKTDWDSYETSWDFSTLPLLQSRQSQATLAATYAALRQQWQAATLEMQQLEEENNRLFIAAYGLQDELTPDVPLAEITLTCNPHYRYGGQTAVNSEQLTVISKLWPEVVANWAEGEAGLELRLLADTTREFISYAVGCMFGRYSLDKPGLILANQGETLEDYLRQVSQPTFLPDKDNAIPMLAGDWFPDDITERFKKFLRLTFGDTHYEDNLAFLEAALGRDVRSYFLRDFYDHHVKMYKKRPIYWLFSSANGSFNVLIYLHRYRPDTVSVILNDYLREFRAKLSARKSHLEAVSISPTTPPRDKTRALKEISQMEATLKEIRDYEDHVLYPLATRQLQIDLDDGVKVNYNKFGPALKKVVGLTE